MRSAALFAPEGELTMEKFRRENISHRKPNPG